MRRRRRRWPAATLVIIVALGIRLAFVAATPGFAPYADAADFDRVAVSLATHGDFAPSTIAPSGGPSGFRAPGYPYLLAALYRVTGTAGSTDRFTIARGLSAVVSTGIVALTATIALLLWGELAALLAGLVTAVYPPLVTIGDAMLSEPLFTALTLAAVVAALLSRRSGSTVRWAIVAGGIVGLAALTRTNGIVIAPAIALGVWGSGHTARTSLRSLAAMLATIALVIAPWCVREAIVFHRLVAITTQEGFTLAGTYNSVSEGDRQRPGAWRVPLMAPYDRLLVPGRDEAALDAAFRARALSFAEGHPAYVVRVGYWNAGRLLELQGPGIERLAARESGISPGVSTLDVEAFYVLAVVAVVSMLGRGARGAPWFVWAAPALMALSLVFIITSMRYRIPIDPFLVLVVAGAAQRIVA